MSTRFRARQGRGRSSGHSSGHTSERWLVSYADLITLLFAFFVLMFAISQADLKKFQAISESLRQAFTGGSRSGGAGAGEGAGTGPSFPGTLGGGAVESSSSGAPGGVALSGAGSSEAGRGASASTDTDLDQIRRLLDEAAELESASFKVTSDRNGEIRWVIQDSYAEQASRVPEDFWPLLRRVSKILARFPEHRIRWEGYCDPAELSEGPARGWQLSAERALWIDQFMKSEWARLGLKRSGLVEVAGLGNSRTLTAETSRFARARNRRVELVVLSRPAD